MAHTEEGKYSYLIDFTMENLLAWTERKRRALWLDFLKLFE